MNQQQFDAFAAELRRMLETRIERPLEKINTRLGHVEEKLKEHDPRFERIDAKFDVIDERFNKVLDGQRNILEAIETKVLYLTGRPE